MEIRMIIDEKIKFYIYDDQWKLDNFHPYHHHQNMEIKIIERATIYYSLP